MIRNAILLGGLCTLFAISLAADAPKNDPKPVVGPRTPEAEKGTFHLAPGFTIDLMASEPDVVDPVSMCFDEKGRLFVAEMRGYPNGGVGTGQESRGRIRCLTDADGDGKFETCTTFAEGLRFPAGLQPWRGGLLVAIAPEIVYLEDTNNDGKADRTTVLYKDFNLSNIQQLVNSLQFAIDNWIHGCAGLDGGTVVSVQKPDARPVSLRNRGLRFQPDVPASLEATSGGGQYGLTADASGHWFVNTNSQHLKQIVLPEHYLQRNPFLSVSEVTTSIAEHGPSAQVFRVSPFEAWRIERTTRRAGDATGRKYAATELVPGGFFTSACSPLIYTADLFPLEYQGNNFVCDPANNLIHRERLEPQGSLFTARRVDVGKEFLASEDNWFRPTSLSIGPDGAIYVLDFYREVIETPLSLPEDIKSKLNLESRGRGRIWRIAPTGFKPSKLPDLSSYNTTQLAESLLDGNSWRRLTAQRLLFERKPDAAQTVLRAKLEAAAGKPGLSNILWALQASGGPGEPTLLNALEDSLPGNRKNALRLCEPYFLSLPALSEKAAKLVDDPSSLVRFQLALSAGAMRAGESAEVLVKLIAKDGADPWMQTAILSSVGENTSEFVKRLLSDKTIAEPLRVVYLKRAASVIGAKAEEPAVAALLERILETGTTNPGSEMALIDGLGQGMRNSKKTLSAWFTQPPALAAKAIEQLKGRFQQAAKVVKDEGAPSPRRLAEARLLAFGPYDLAGPTLAALLAPSVPGDLQIVAARGLAGFTQPDVAEKLLKEWSSYGPSLKREVLDALMARTDSLLQLLAAVEKGTIAPGDLDLARVQQLKAHPVSAVKSKAISLFKSQVNADRAKVVTEYASIVDLKGNVENGKTLFKKNCAACHRVGGEGNDVGAPLIATLPGKSAADLVASVFDPNREVDPRYINYLVSTADGRQIMGIVAVETPTSITLKRAEGLEDTILRTNLEALRSTRLSLMPEGFEKVLSKQDAADLFAYLRSAISGK